MRSGWCSAPTGARPQHEWCRSAVCRCECHGDGIPLAAAPTIKRRGRSAWDDREGATWIDSL